jgi:ribosome biogenesis GTPase
MPSHPGGCGPFPFHPFHEDGNVSLQDYGWSDFFGRALDELADPALEPGRVLTARGGWYRIVTKTGECSGSVAGRLKHHAVSEAELPAVGDWVALRREGEASAVGHRIERVLERRTRLSRQFAGRRTGEQVVAANVDTVFLVTGLDGDFNLRRLERLLATAWQSGARPVIVLNKSDLVDDPLAYRREVERLAPGVSVLRSSCVDPRGIDEVAQYLVPRETAVLVGSSGVGKSSLINRLSGDAWLPTAAVRAGDDRGRHTTTHRELFRLAGGCLIIDSPGVREIQLWVGEESLDLAFEDIVALAARCRFRDCTHEAETGCAVLAAADVGQLEPGRLESYRRLRKEQRYHQLREDQSARRIEKQKWRAIHREMRRAGRHRRR